LEIDLERIVTPPTAHPVGKWRSSEVVKAFTHTQFSIEFVSIRLFLNIKLDNYLALLHTWGNTGLKKVGMRRRFWW
jgi:hypothetical protein